MRRPGAPHMCGALQDTMWGMADAEIMPAPRWRRTLAGSLDAALGVGFTWATIRRARDAAADGSRNWTGPLGAAAAGFIREQVGSPGQRLFGVRTVDARTGRRVTLWKTLVLLGAAAGTQALVRRLQPAEDPEARRTREDLARELQEISRRHAHDAATRDAELTRYLHEHHPPAGHSQLLRSMALPLVAGLLNQRLRRRLAPTREMLARPRADHSP